MNNKQNFQTVLILLFSLSIMFAHTLETPRGSSVDHSHPWDLGWDDWGCA